MYDYLIVGAGIYGATFAQQAHERGKSVLVIDRRNHIAGNAYTEKRHGIHVHAYGAHIFHTADEEVWRYVNRFAAFNSFVHAPVANYHGKLYSLPFNMHTFRQMWGVETAEEAAAIIEAQRKGFTGEPQNLEETAISLVGRDIYETLVRGYTEKQWGRSCTELPPFIIRRLPCRMTYDNRYFSNPYQGIPIGGYTQLVANMLEGIEVRLGEDYLQNRRAYDAMAHKVIYTGAIDEFFDYALGPLEYRSVRFETEYLETPSFQGNAVVNYTDRETPWTRIIEHKWFDPESVTDEGRNGTIISREYSHAWTIGEAPYYPVNDARNAALYDRYRALAAERDNVIFGGRLGEYRYYDMDKTIASALKTARACLGD